MPLSHAALTARITHSTLDIEGETLNVDWYPKRLTSEMMHRVGETSTRRLADMSVAETLAAIDTAAESLAQLVGGWDFYEYIDEDGTPGPVIEPTLERLRQCSIELLWAIFNALLGETRMGEANGTSPQARSRASSSTVTRGGSRR